MTNHAMNILNDHPAVHTIHAAFQAAGFDLWFVGGCVRDTLNGQLPKDIDMATSATPDQQIQVYRDNGFSYHETGLQHGTITVVMNDEPYEITTLRTETEHDGRHAAVSWTSDIDLDLSRRDLTINAIAMKIDGTIIDPFGGAEDLANGRVRFVGNATERMKEDYLRIMRFFRFHTRFSPNATIDPETREAIMANVNGLSDIAVERIWWEMTKIISDKNAIRTLKLISETISNAIMLPKGNTARLTAALEAGVKNPAILMTAYLGPYVGPVSRDWKWSRAERKAAALTLSHTKLGADYGLHKNDYSINDLRELLNKHVPREVVSDLAALAGHDRDLIDNWSAPVFPLSGHDLMDRMKPGPEMGETLDKLRNLWRSSDYKMDKDQLLEAI